MRSTDYLAAGVVLVWATSSCADGNKNPTGVTSTASTALTALTAPTASTALTASINSILPPNTPYGDANLDGQIDVLDARLVANWAVGNLAPPVPGDGEELASNVVPVNNSGLGGAGDSLPPGWESSCTRRIDVLDAATIAQAAVGNSHPVAGAQIPADAFEFPSGLVRGGTCGSGRIPLTDLGASRYLGTYQGGLYPGGTNTIPASHAAGGAAAARRVRARNVAGTPSSTGKIVLLSVGMSHVTQEWCSDIIAHPCVPWSFMAQAASDPTVNHAMLAIANGAKAGETAPAWSTPGNPIYDYVRDSVLAPGGLSEKQVQVVWLKEADGDPQLSLPTAQSDAFALESTLGDIARSLKARYPNLQLLLVSSRSYGGFAISRQNPEPYAYESGFAVKWLIEAQITQQASGTVDPRAGDLNYNSGVAPWIAWGPYLWADGYRPRSDGLRWLPAHFESDGMHPSPQGEGEVANRLLTFFKTDPRTSCWFVSGRVCP